MPVKPPTMKIELEGVADLDLMSEAVNYCKGLTKKEMGKTHKHKGVTIKITYNE